MVSGKVIALAIILAHGLKNIHEATVFEGLPAVGRIAGNDNGHPGRTDLGLAGNRHRKFTRQYRRNLLVRVLVLGEFGSGFNAKMGHRNAIRVDHPRVKAGDQFPFVNGGKFLERRHKQKIRPAKMPIFSELDRIGDQ
jgi:hypothetical protein